MGVSDGACSVRLVSRVFVGLMGCVEPGSRGLGKVANIAQSSEHAIVQAMSQVSLKDLELSGLTNQKTTLENLSLQREKERRTWEAKC